jgi:hypothetical protein
VIEARKPEEVADRLTRFHKRGLAGIIAIDGKDGAGKDCLAQNLQKRLGGGVVSLDCFIRQKNQGGYVPYLDIDTIRKAIEACTRPKIIAGCCMLQVLNSTGHKQDVLIYAKRVMFNPIAGYDWLDADLLQGRKAAPDEVTKEIVRYHDKFKPLRIAEIAFLHTYKKGHCQFHL